MSTRLERIVRIDQEIRAECYPSAARLAAAEERADRLRSAGYEVV
jgi:hypothetical protein